MIAQPSVLFNEQQIAQRIKELGAEVSRAYEGKDLCVIALMKGCLVFMADLIRTLGPQTSCYFLQRSSVPGEAGGSVCLDIVYNTEIPYEGRDILMLDDIIDTGITLNFLLDQVRDQHPRTLKVCTLIDKPADRKVDVKPDWSMFTISAPLKDDGFIVGYGLDYDERYRGLGYIGMIPRPAGRKAGV